MSNSVSVASFRAVLVEVADAIDALDLATAERKLLKAGVIMAGLEVEKGSQGGSVHWRNDLNALREQLDKLRAQQNATSERRIFRGRTNFS